MDTPADKTAKRLSADDARRAIAPTRAAPRESYKRANMSAPADKDRAPALKRFQSYVSFKRASRDAALCFWRNQIPERRLPAGTLTLQRAQACAGGNAGMPARSRRSDTGLLDRHKHMRRRVRGTGVAEVRNDGVGHDVSAMRQA